MKTLIQAATFVLLAGTPAFAEDAAAPGKMTCGEFLALDGAGQTKAMLTLRALHNAEPAPAADQAAATAADSASGTAAEATATTDEPAAASPTTDPKLTAMRTSCEGIPDALAMDAMVAAHADYE